MEESATQMLQTQDRLQERELFDKSSISRWLNFVIESGMDPKCACSIWLMSDLSSTSDILPVRPNILNEKYNEKVSESTNRHSGVSPPKFYWHTYLLLRL